MKKILKLLLSAFLSISLMCGSFVFSMPVYAVSLSDINAYFDVQRKFYQILDQTTDIQTTQEHQTSILNKMYDLLEENGYSGSRSGEGLESSGNVTINSTGDVLLSVDLQNAIRTATQNEIDNNMGYKYIYSFNTASFIDAFNEQTQFHAFLNCVSSLESSNILFIRKSDKKIYALPSTTQFVYRQGNSTGTTYVWLYNNWSSITLNDFVTYAYDSSSTSYVEVANDSYLPSLYYTCSTNSTLPNPPNDPDLINTNITQYQMYMTTNDMRLGSEGLQPYYVGNDFSTSTVTNTQTITDSMLNSSISYNNISDYVNNYYVTNTTYPSSQDVYNYINNYDGSGNGSGNGSGESGDSDNDNNFDWGFLGTIGDFLGGLLSGISGVISGLLEGITGIIDLFIGSENAETGQREGGLPSIIGQLLNYFLPFLPSEILTLIELSIVLALIIGVVKLIRGS